MNKIEGRQTQYGFIWGPAQITRLFCDQKKGWVTIGLTTKKDEIQLYITKTGKIRIFSGTKEWQKPNLG
jgi:hypothetical protein